MKKVEYHKVLLAKFAYLILFLQFCTQNNKHAISYSIRYTGFHI